MANLHWPGGKQWASTGSNWVLACDTITIVSVSCTCPTSHTLLFLCHLRMLSVCFWSMVLFCRLFIKACQWIVCVLIAQYFTTVKMIGVTVVLSVDYWLCWRLAVYCASISNMKTVLVGDLLWSTTPVIHHIVQQICLRIIYSQQYGIKIYRNIAMSCHIM